MSPINPYFQSGLGPGISTEQQLVEDLIVESLKVYGIETYYLPRASANIDPIFIEDPMSRFTSYYPIEMYMANVAGFEGAGDLFTKFGIQITDQATFVVAKRRWEETATRTSSLDLPERPAEGDLIYFPLTKSFFEIKFVQHQNPFYQLGKFYVYSLQCELFQYSSELVQTGDPEIDDPFKSRSQDLATWAVVDQSGSMLAGQDGTVIVREDAPADAGLTPFDQNQTFETEASQILDFSIQNPFGEV